jgi:acyl-CoA thioesterase FadM
VNLYLRLLLLVLRLHRIRQRGLFEESRIPFRVLPVDCDVNLHMNNGRYLSFMDLGRVHLIAQLGLLGEVVRNRWKPVLAAAEINFIRQLAPFQRFELVTRVVTWDEKYVYMEQRFESGGVLCAHSFVKGLFLSGTAKVSNASVVALTGYTGEPPDMTDALKLWVELGNVKKQHA